MIHTEITSIQCPYCWQKIELVIDCSIQAQEYVEDCSVCCKPILLNIVVTNDNDIQVDAWQENG